MTSLPPAHCSTEGAWELGVQATPPAEGLSQVFPRWPVGQPLWRGHTAALSPLCLCSLWVCPFGFVSWVETPEAHPSPCPSVLSRVARGSPSGTWQWEWEGWELTWTAWEMELSFLPQVWGEAEGAGDWTRPCSCSS